MLASSTGRALRPGAEVCSIALRPTVVIIQPGKIGSMSTDAAVTIRFPWWVKAVVTGLSAAGFVVAVVARLTLQDPWMSIVGIPAVAAGGGLAPAAINTFVGKLEIRGDRLVWTAIGRSRECLVRDITAMRLSPMGSGMARCAFIRRDGSLAFGRKVAWAEDGLMRLAQSMPVVIERQP
jgi:hypothetical protein